MMESPQCSWNVQESDLSAWEAGMIDESFASQLTKHVPTCPACQAQLMDINNVGRILRAYHAPSPGPQLWRVIQQGMDDEQRNQPYHPYRRFFAGTGIFAIFLVTVVLFVALLDRQGTATHPGATPTTSQPTETITPTQTITPSQTATSTEPVPAWQSSDPSYAMSIAFAPSAPLTGYACGEAVPHAYESNIIVGRTNDGGQTWNQPSLRPIMGVQCEILINPLNPRDVVVNALLCDEACGAGPFYLAQRSLDGGISWDDITLPDGKGIASLRFTTTALYAGSAVGYTGNSKDPPSNRQRLAVSINAGPMAWVNEADLLGDQVIEGITNLLGAGATIYVPISYSDMRKSSDNGQTWTNVTFQSDGIPVHVLTIGTDGKTIIAYSLKSDLISRDGGQTWRICNCNYYALIAIDGTAYFQKDDGMYRLRSDETSATRIGQRVAQGGGGVFWAIQYGDHDQPIALWSRRLGEGHVFILQKLPLAP